MNNTVQKNISVNNKMTFYVTPEVREYFDREANFQKTSRSAILQSIVQKTKPKNNIIQRFNGKIGKDVGGEFEKTLKSIKTKKAKEKGLSDYQNMFN